MDFYSFARLHGLEIKNLTPSSRIQRCGTIEHPRSTNGAFLYEGDRGWVQNWAESGDIEWWDDEQLVFDEEARAEWAKRKAAREAEQLKMWGKTAIRCRMLRDTTKVGEHDYMHRKGLGDVLVPVLPDGELFIPMFDVASSALVGAQLIHWDMEERKFVKKFVPGSRLKGSAMLIGPADSGEFIFCEGFATGHSIDKALRQMRLRATVIVCFNDSNMINVSKLVTTGRRYVFADNDKSEAGESAAQATGLNYCMSPVVGEDANDLHKRAGIAPVMQLLMTARKLKATA